MNILITGGTGLVGTRLSAVLTAAGHHVAHVSRTLAPGSAYRTFQWDPAAGTIDPAAVPFAEAVVNLAGANVGEGQWTVARKQELLTSRVDGLTLLHRELAKAGHRVRTVVSASAIGFYGATGDALVTEDTPPVGHDLLADLTQAWEQAAAPLAALGEQSEMVLTGKRVSAAKVLAQGFAFEFPGLREALQAFYAPELTLGPQPAQLLMAGAGSVRF